MQLPRATRLVVRIAGEQMYLWRAVDHEGEVLDMQVQRRRDSRAALRLMRKLLKKQGFAPKLLVTDKLRSYALAFRLAGGIAQVLQDATLAIAAVDRPKVQTAATSW